MNNYQKKWEIIFILPNLPLKKSFGNDKIAIVPYNDSRVVESVSSNKIEKYLVNNFENQFGKRMYPALLLICSNAPTKIQGIEAIIDFKNIFAISAIIKGYEYRLLTSTNTSVNPYPLYSDYFDFYPISSSEDNDCFIINSPSTHGIYDEIQNFHGQTSPRLTISDFMGTEPDDQIFSLLEKAWKRHFVGKSLQQTRRLFRSLEIAYWAVRMPPNILSKEYDFGTSASLWVSAFEILSHPQRGKVNLCTVLKLLGKYDWINKKVKRKAYKLNYRGQQCRVNLVQKLYKELYDTRNDFLHGNPIRDSRLYPFKNRKVRPITQFAPLIYKVALLSYLKQDKPESEKSDCQNEYITKLNNERELSEAILKSKGN